MKRQPSFDITIVTPSYNQAQFLEATINSVWSQKGNFRLQHIIADGGSTDTSLKIIKKYHRLYQKNHYPFACKKFTFSYWSRPDQGQTDALIKGFNQAQGQILSWLNSDDLYANPHTLQKVFLVFKNHPQADLVIGRSHTIDDTGQITGVVSTCHDLQVLLVQPFISQPATFFTRKVLNNCKLDPNLHYTMDWDFLIQAYLKKLRFYSTNTFLASERIHSQAKTTKDKLKLYKEWLKVYRKHNLHPRAKWSIMKNIAIEQLKALYL